MPDPLSTFNLRETPQTEQARADQVQNNAGGWGFKVDDWTRALRFLVLGVEGGTYYVSERDLTRDNAKAIIKLANEQGEKLVQLIVDVSERGRAPRQNPTLFALAACTASEDLATRRAASAAIQRVCRTGTMLFIFARYVEQFRGWGRNLKSAIADWYLDKPVKDVAYQAVKYRQREGWSHRDLVRLSHPRTSDPERGTLLTWIDPGYKDDSITRAYSALGLSVMPELVNGFTAAHLTSEPKEWVRLVEQFKLPWEALPDAALGHAGVWEALLPDLGMTALIRQLGRLTNLGIISPLSAGSRQIAERLTNAEAIRKARVHPLNILVAHRTYAKGTGFRGTSTWNPDPKIVEALNDAFYLAFEAVEPANKRTLWAMDVSGSMKWGTVAGSPLTPMEAEAAMAMVTLRTEPEFHPMGFSHQLVPVPLSKSMRLDGVIKRMGEIPMGGTNCALPMQWAAQNKVPVDTFIVSTDNETWAGGVHPYQALVRYRDIMGIQARLVVVGMTATDFTIADPKDAGMLDVVGFDTAAPNLISSFSRGEI